MWWVLGLSIVLSGCLEIEATTTVLEDGRVIDHMVVQPKSSLVALLNLSAKGVSAAGHGSDTASSRTVGGSKRLALLEELRTFGDLCVIMDGLYEEAFAKQRIPYSAVSVPTDFEFPEIVGNGCSIQMGPYDPRTLPADFAKEVLGIRIESAVGLHEPYRMSAISIEEALEGIPFSASLDGTKLQAICSGELEPALCQQELRILSILIESWVMEFEGSDSQRADSQEFEKLQRVSQALKDILSDPGMLGGAAEMLRMVLKSVPVTYRIPDNTAVGNVHGASNHEYGHGWIWRGSFMELMSADTNSGMSIQVRPTRHPTPFGR